MSELAKGAKSLMVAAARDQAPARVTAGERREQEGVDGAIVGAEARQGPVAEFRLREIYALAPFEIGDFLTVQTDVRDQIYRFEAFVVQQERAGRTRSLFLQVTGGPEPKGQRKSPRVAPGARMHVSLKLDTQQPSLRSQATDQMGGAVDGLLRNISAGGVAVSFHRRICERLALGDQVSLSLRLPDEASETMLAGTVVYMQNTRRETTHCGIAFLEAGPNRTHLARIGDFVVQQRKARALASSGLRFW